MNRLLAAIYGDRRPEGLAANRADPVAAVSAALEGQINFPVLRLGLPNFKGPHGSDRPPSPTLAPFAMGAQGTAIRQPSPVSSSKIHLTSHLDPENLLDQRPFEGFNRENREGHGDGGFPGLTVAWRERK